MSSAAEESAWPGPDGGWTISVLSREPESGRLGIAIAASSIAIGARCPLLSVGKAVVTSQGFSNLKLGPLAVDLLHRGLAAEEVMAALRRHDRWIDFRQIAIVADEGAIEAHTGAMNGAWAGHLVVEDVVALGNGLIDAAPLQAMITAYAAGAAMPMPARLLAALQAGAAANAGAVSSALLVRAPSDVVQIDLRVDLARATPAEGGNAIDDLARLLKAYAPLVEIYERRSMSPEPGRLDAGAAESDATASLETQE